MATLPILDTSAHVWINFLPSIYFFRGKECKETPLPLLPLSQFRFWNESLTLIIIYHCVTFFLLFSIYFFRVKKVKDNPYHLYPFTLQNLKWWWTLPSYFPMCDLFSSSGIYFSRVKKVKKNPYPLYPFSHTSDFEMMMNTDLDTSACFICFSPIQYWTFQG